MELKKDIKSELEKIKQMSVKDRIWYIYEYYKFHIVAVILAFTLLWVVACIARPLPHGLLSPLSMTVPAVSHLWIDLKTA